MYYKFNITYDARSTALSFFRCEKQLR